MAAITSEHPRQWIALAVLAWALDIVEVRR
jgi:hypothetical protein